MSRPLASVVIGNHNYGRFLGSAVRSVLFQDVPQDDFEVIVVDDGSTDSSREVLAGFGGRVRAFFQERSGQATAINRGLAEARGEVVCLLDADDVWLPGKLKAVLPLFDDARVGAVQHRLQDTDAALNPLRELFPDWPERYRLDDFLDGRVHFTATSGLALRRRALEGVLPIPRDLFYYLDDYLAVGTLLRAELANVPQVLGLHRIHGGNWCAGGYADPRKIEEDFRNRKIFSERLAAWLKETGRALSPRYRAIESLELLRRKVLYESLRARPAEACRAWWDGLREARTGFGRFRLLTLLVAAASPTLYLFLYALYSQAAPLQALRLRLFPESRQNA